MKKEYIPLLEDIKKSNKIVFFGGAGVSTASGIPDFRSSEGIFVKYQKLSPEVIVSHNFFLQYPKEFYDFYFDKMIYLNAKPNYCHKALAYLEKIGKLTFIITQNIDNLHQMAGSKNVLELHGSVMRYKTLYSNLTYTLDEVLKLRKNDQNFPFINNKKDLIKPDVVLYGEALDNSVLEKSVKALNQADLLIVGGTSLKVYPAAGLLSYYYGKKIYIIDKEKINYPNATLIKDDISQVFEAILIELKKAGL